MSESRVVHHAVLTFATMVLTTLIGIASRVLLTRGLGPDGLGQYTGIVLLPLLSAAFMTLGINVSAVHLVGSGRLSPRDASSVAFSVPLLTSLIAVPILAFLAPALSNRYLDGAPVPALRVTLLALPAILLASCAGGVLQGVGRLRAYNAISLAGPVLSLGVLIVATLSGGVRLGSALAAWLVLQTAAALVAVVLLARQTGLRIIPDRAAAGAMLRLGLLPYAANTLGLASRRVDSVVLLALLGTHALGLYSLASGMAELFWFAASAAAIALAPEVARRGKEDKGALTAATSRVVLIVMGGSLLAWLVVDRRLIALLFGASFVPAAAPLRALFPAIVAASVEKVIVGDLTGRGTLWVAPVVSLLAFGVSAAGTVLLVPSFGPVGAAVASSAGAVASTIVTLRVYSRLSGQSWRALLIPRFQDVVGAARAIKAALPFRRRAPAPEAS